jgi:hypothetical protein
MKLAFVFSINHTPYSFIVQIIIKLIGLEVCQNSE